MSAHACVSVVVPGFMVGGSAAIACTTVPPRTGVCASTTTGTANSINPRANLNMSDLRSDLFMSGHTNTGRVASGAPAAQPAEWALRKCAQPAGLRFTKRRVAKPAAQPRPRGQAPPASRTEELVFGQPEHALADDVALNLA